MTFHTPALKKLCPVQAYINWITVAGIARGPVFRKVDRWGNIAESGINSNSLIPLLRRILKQSGVSAELYSSHSMRRGFATWASANGWDIKGLMSYVGWKDVKSALRYVDASTSFGGMALRAATPKLDAH
ncbi:MULTISPECIES: tyrosine-type recombinase/integrase [unclassified Pseudomonas]|uniref:tyrosine-type recombinase/integrase n=1 Tax=unclassified Pseudomonas TaxID=196821 RepID=UPI001EF02FC9|nr:MULTISPECIES: tyrosine-type recombinase/integrase [unclassified Pseudomonas]